MTDLPSAVALLRDPRLAAHAVASEPAWLWAPDGSRVLWANAAGAAIFDCLSSAELTARKFSPSDDVAAQVARVSGALHHGAPPRLERLRGFSPGVARLLVCACSRIALADHAPAILIVAREKVGLSLPFAERVRRLYHDWPEAVAVFDAEGGLLFASPAAIKRLGSTASVTAIGADALAAEAWTSGRAAGDLPIGRVVLERIGTPPSAVLSATLSGQAQQVEIAAPPAPKPPIAPPAPVATVTSPAPAATVEVPAPPASATPLASPPTIPPEPKRPDARPGLPPAAGLRFDTPADPRRHPMRFVWQMDVSDVFTLTSEEFLAVVGARTAAALGKSWRAINDELALDRAGQVAQAIATRDTWSGVTVSWPLDPGTERLRVEMSGLPVYDRQRKFVGYRGFGVCREIEAIERLVKSRRTDAPAIADTANTSATDERPAPRKTDGERIVQALVTSAPNVVPFRIVTAPAETRPTAETKTAAESKPAGSDAKTPALSPVERKAFSDLARQLSARIKTGGEAAGETLQDSDTPQPPAWLAQGSDARALLDRLPLAILVYRVETLLYANRAFLERAGYASLDEFSNDGGLETLFIESGSGSPEGDGQSLMISSSRGGAAPAAGRLFAIPWEGEVGQILVLSDASSASALPSSAPDIGDSRAALRQAQVELKKAQQDLADARQRPRESAVHPDLLGKIGRDIRKPATSIVGLAEIMLQERFGPIGNERYREYLADMRGSGERIAALLDEILNLSQIETGTIDLGGARLSLNELIQTCVVGMQPQASRLRVLIRTSLVPELAPIGADETSVRQIVINLLTASVNLAGRGGQVIVSTALAGSEVVLRLRDTGPGLSEQDIAMALQPARQAAVPEGEPGPALDLTLTKAMVEANRGRFAITSKLNDGTLIEVVFPAAKAKA